MNPSLAVLQEFYRDKLTMLLRHQAGARLVGQYDLNNTYQYVINREDVQLSWLTSAIADLGGSPPEVAEAPAVQGKVEQAPHAVLEADAREAQGFVDRWRPRVEALSNARHKLMLKVILGETLEQKRFFEQALAGRTDLLGRRADVLEPASGEVLPTRWIE